MIAAPPTSLLVTEHEALEVHAGTVGTLFGVGSDEALELAGRTGHSVVAGFHGGLLDLGGFGLLDRLGGSGTLQNGTQLDLLRLDPLQQLDLLAKASGTGLERAEGRLLLGTHRGSVTFGGHLRGRFHLGNHRGEFVEQLLELVHVKTPVYGMGDACRPHHQNYGHTPRPLQ